jgi:3-oxoacyl-[acyl-carrier-protein] synthase II
MNATATLDDDLVISGWSAATAFGLGAEAFLAGLRAGSDALTGLERREWPSVRYRRAGLIPDFDAAAVLGRKGTRAMDRVTAIAVATVGMLLDQHPGLRDEPERIGLVLGTGSGSLQSTMDFTRESFTQDKPFHVDPARFPNAVMNRAAGQCAIWYGLKGPNTTITGGALTGLLALNYAVRLQRGGHSELTLCGAVEEFSAQRGWLEWHGAVDPGEADPAPLGEGCALFLLEPSAGAIRHGRRPLASVRAARFRVFETPEQAGAAVAACVAGVLEAAGVTPAEVGIVATSEAGGELGRQEEAGLAEMSVQIWLRIDADPSRIKCLANISVG